VTSRPVSGRRCCDVTFLAHHNPTARLHVPGSPIRQTQLDRIARTSDALWLYCMHAERATIFAPPPNRLWITAEPHPQFPIGLLQVGARGGPKPSRSKRHSPASIPNRQPGGIMQWRHCLPQRLEMTQQAWLHKVSIPHRLPT
jgi:hypothetical protein